MNRHLLQLAEFLSAENSSAKRRAELLATWSHLDSDETLSRRHRVGPSLALQASILSPEDLERLDPKALQMWRRRLRAVSTQQMHLDGALEDMAESLGGEIPWAPIKGMDLAYRVYPRSEERPTSDLDVLICGEDLAEARRRLLEAGWTPLQDGPRVESYLLDEGYAWQARNREGALLELHHRLWAWVHPELGAACLGAAVADPSLPAGGRRLTAADAYLVAAVHLWLDAPPRAFTAFRDLRCLALSSAEPSILGRDIVVRARRFELALPVLAAARVVDALWSDTVARAVVDGLEDDLRAAERYALSRIPELDAAPLSRWVLARHLSRRRARHRLSRSLWRRLWVHPGVVEAGSPDTWPWWARRLAYQVAAAGSRRLYPLFDRIFSGRDNPSDPTRRAT